MLLTIGFAVLLPFAVVEMLTGKDVLRRTLEPYLQHPGARRGFPGRASA